MTGVNSSPAENSCPRDCHGRYARSAMLARGFGLGTVGQAIVKFDFYQKLLLCSPIIMSIACMSLRWQEADVPWPFAAQWRLIRPLREPRSGHAAALLPGDDILVVGGGGLGLRPLSSAEIITQLNLLGGEVVYDAHHMSAAHHECTAIPLDSRHILVFGTGESGTGVHLYDTRYKLFKPGPQLIDTNRKGAAVLAMTDGRILVTGGRSNKDDSIPTQSVEIYNSRDGTWSQGPPMLKGRTYHRATLLPSGNVLVTGGYLNTEERSTSTCEIYDMKTNAWREAQRMSLGRCGHVQLRLPDGRVVVIGGSTDRYEPLRSCEIYDEANAKWALWPDLNDARYSHAAIVTKEGFVIVAGGMGGAKATEVLRSVEILRTHTSKGWRHGVAMQIPRHHFVLLELEVGLLAIGGNVPDIATLPEEVRWGSCEILYRMGILER